MPVSASGEKLARSSRKTRISSSQSMSSSAKVTRPSSAARLGVEHFADRLARALDRDCGSPRKRVASRVSPLHIG